MDTFSLKNLLFLHCILDTSHHDSWMQTKFFHLMISQQCSNFRWLRMLKLLLLPLHQIGVNLDRQRGSVFPQELILDKHGNVEFTFLFFKMKYVLLPTILRLFREKLVTHTLIMGWRLGSSCCLQFCSTTIPRSYSSFSAIIEDL